MSDTPNVDTLKTEVELRAWVEFQMNLAIEDYRNGALAIAAARWDQASAKVRELEALLGKEEGA